MNVNVCLSADSDEDNPYAYGLISAHPVALTRIAERMNKSFFHIVGIFCSLCSRFLLGRRALYALLARCVSAELTLCAKALLVVSFVRVNHGLFHLSRF